MAAETNNYKVSLLGLCEITCKHSGQMILSSGETILYSGHEEDNASIMKKLPRC